MKIGVLALQGGFQEHIHHINELGYDGVLVKTVEDLKNIKALIIPGGESTTMGKLLKVTGLLSPLKEMIKNGLPVWGTCAGMILLAKNIDGETVTRDRIEFNPYKCDECGDCIEACPYNMLHATGNEKFPIMGFCTLCGQCIEACPKNALYDA